MVAMEAQDQFSAVDLQALVERPEGVRAWADFEDRMAKFWSSAPMADDQWKRPAVSSCCGRARKSKSPEPGSARRR